MPLFKVYLSIFLVRFINEGVVVAVSKHDPFLKLLPNIIMVTFKVIVCDEGIMCLLVDMRAHHLECRLGLVV